jgi:hypothetical protein
MGSCWMRTVKMADHVLVCRDTQSQELECLNRFYSFHRDLRIYGSIPDILRLYSTVFQAVSQAAESDKFELNWMTSHNSLRRVVFCGPDSTLFSNH